MSKVFHLTARAKSIAPVIRTEDECIQTAERLAAAITEGSSLRDRERLLPHHEVELVKQSGLLGVTVPSDFGGADISNAFVAEAIAIMSAADASVGQIPHSHYSTLETLRLAGTQAQKNFFFARALAGEMFANAQAEIETSAAGAVSTQFTEDGPGYRISGKKYYSTGALFADWIAILGLDPQGRQVMAIVPRATNGLTIIDDWDGFGQKTTASGTVLIDDVYVSADAVISHHLSLTRHAPLGSLAQLLHSAIDLGIARAAFSDMIAFVQQKSRGNADLGIDKAVHDTLTIARTGTIAVKLEAAGAMLERAGHKVDIAQVDPSHRHSVDASIAVAVTKILTTDAALEASNGLFELAGASATKSDYNLDRHWRNARTHTVHDPVRWKHHTIGNFHLNNIIPRPHTQF